MLFFKTVKKASSHKKAGLPIKGILSQACQCDHSINHKSKCVCNIQTIVDKEEIEKITCEFYGKLYSDDRIDDTIFTQLSNIDCTINQMSPGSVNYNAKNFKLPVER